MNREQSAFLLGGLVLGLILGLVIGLVVMGDPVGEPGGAGAAGPMPAERGTSDAGSGVAAAPGMSAPPGMAAPATGGMDPGAAGAAVMGQVTQALQALKGAVEKNPNDLKALTQLGDMYFDAGKFEDSKAWYERAVQVNPKDPQLLTALALSELNLGKPQVALERCEQALVLDASFWPAAAYSVIAAVEMGDQATARNLLARLKTLNPGFEHMKDFEQRVAQMGAGGPAAAPAS